MSEYGYMPEAPEQSFGNNKGIFTPKEIYDLTRADKYTNLGQLELIETKTVSGVTSLDFDNLGTYDIHLLTAHNVSHTTGAATDIGMRYYGVSTGLISTSVYETTRISNQGGGALSLVGSTSNSHALFLNDVDNNTNDSVNGYNHIHNALDPNIGTHNTYHNHCYVAHAGSKNRHGTSICETVEEINALLLYTTNGASFIGTFSLYGMKTYE